MPHAATAMFGALPRGDGTPPLHLLAVIGPEMEALRQSLQEAPSPSVLFSLFGDWLMTRPGYGERWAVPADEDRAQILAERMGISIRSLRRLFARDIGLAPKRLLQLNRLNAVLQDPDLLSSAVPLAELAGKHGFADQAHMTRQISRLTGATPHELRGRNPSNPPHMRDEVAGLFNSGSPG